MSRLRNRTRSPRTGFRRSGIVLRWLLLVVAWQGPLPWIHCHGTLAEGQSDGSLWMAEHLQTHHASAPLFANICFGWHFHTLLPRTTSREPTQPPSPDVAPPPAATGVAQLTLGAGAPEAWDQPVSEVVVAAARPGGPILAAGTSSAADHFWDTFAPDLSLPQKLGVARC